MKKQRLYMQLRSLLAISFAVAIGLAVSTPSSAQFFSNKTQELLPEDQPFR